MQAQLPRTAPTPGPSDAVDLIPRPNDPRNRKKDEEEDTEPPTLSTPRPFPEGPLAADNESRISVRPRTGQKLQWGSESLPDGSTAIIFTNGVIVRAVSPRKAAPPPAPKKDAKPGDLPPPPPPPGPPIILDIEADRLVVWTKGTGQNLVDGLSSPQGQTGRSYELYLSGNVELRIRSEKDLEQTIRADQVYYDVSRNVAVALKADLEAKQAPMPYPVHVEADELLQVNPKLIQAKHAVVYSTILPSDPGLRIELRDVDVEEIDKPKRGFLGFPVKDPVTGEPVIDRGHYFRGRNVVTRLESVPIFYSPWMSGRVEDPLGPLENIGFNYNRIFGTQFFTTWDIYQLLGLQPLPGTRWRLYADYLSVRGPALGQEFDWNTFSVFGVPAKVESLLKMYGINDKGRDVLGGSLGQFLPINPQTLPGSPFDHPNNRGRLLGQMNVQELPYGFSYQGMIALISDRNFLPQYYLNEYLTGLNQETYAYLKQQQNFWAWTLLGDVRVDMPWVTRTNWLPKADLWGLGISLFDYANYNAHLSAGFAQLKTADLPPPVTPTDRPVDTGRLDLFQDLSLPLYAGPLKIVPYVQADFAYYSQGIQGNNGNNLDAGAAYQGLVPGTPGFYGTPVQGNDVGRAYGGAGLRASLPLSRLYPDVHSELLNLDGIYHKIQLSGNYYYGRSNVSLFNLPQLDRLNDDAADRTLRDIYPYQTMLNPANANFLTTSALFNPQMYALQRLLAQQTMEYTDSLGNIDVFQLGLRQRWQTKRGFPGNEHVVDWMMLDLRASVFPEYKQVSFTNPFGILEYDWVWNVGDRTALTSSGWMEPTDGGPRYFNFGSYINRPDGTNVYIGYRQIDPLLSRAVIASIAYPFNAKYSLTASTAWDFGAKNQTYMILLTRMGTDLMVTAGISYNSILNNFGVTFEIIPSLLRGQIGRTAGFGVMNGANGANGPINGSPSSGR